MASHREYWRELVTCYHQPRLGWCLAQHLMLPNPPLCIQIPDNLCSPHPGRWASLLPVSSLLGNPILLKWTYSKSFREVKSPFTLHSLLCELKFLWTAFSLSKLPSTVTLDGLSKAHAKGWPPMVMPALLFPYKENILQLCVKKNPQTTQSKNGQKI